MLRVVWVEASSDELASVEWVMVGVNARPLPAEDAHRVACKDAGAEPAFVLGVVATLTGRAPGSLG